ncbi:uncharacterized protein IL334_006267 [Kwoniella shivajii]|uniref:Major facilitator superfamily (MFS) profile domain-containing protein n=1 Tax=Kwoniella shivajii TaxID=564305 RepID=A0ABZ1D645_9TREE|nr:hypothetical protein IL334_006267 [Kwoniella shivajii]
MVDHGRQSEVDPSSTLPRLFHSRSNEVEDGQSTNPMEDLSKKDLLAHAEVDSPSSVPLIRMNTDNENNHDNNNNIVNSTSTATPMHPQATRLYKRRFFALAQLSLLNIIVSWCWLTFASLSKTSATFFDVSESAINWLSTGFLFAFVIASPITLYSLNKKGCKYSMIIASILLLLGSWIRYIGTRLPENSSSNSNPDSSIKRRFGMVLFGQIIIGFAQPFVLSAPTRLSHQWFSEKGRITATALASLCNPLGGALGQLIGPFMADSPEQVPNLVLYVAIITTVITVPTIFIPAGPPIPPTTTPFQDTKIDMKTIRSLFSNLTFHLIAWPFIIYVAAFNSTSSLLNQILGPYGLSEDQAGIDGAVMIVVGLLASAIASPILDHYKLIRLTAIKILVITISVMYIAFIYIPKTKNLIGPAIISAIIGSSSFILLPLALELLADVTWPIGPEVSSTICWSLSQLAGGILLVSMSALKGGMKNEPDNSMFRSLVLQGVLCCIAAPLPLCLGLWGTGKRKRDSKGDISTDPSTEGNEEIRLGTGAMTA